MYWLKEIYTRTVQKNLIHDYCRLRNKLKITCYKLGAGAEKVKNDRLWQPCLIPALLSHPTYFIIVSFSFQSPPRAERSANWMTAIRRSCNSTWVGTCTLQCAGPVACHTMTFMFLAVILHFHFSVDYYS